MNSLRVYSRYYYNYFPLNRLIIELDLDVINGIWWTMNIEVLNDG